MKKYIRENTVKSFFGNLVVNIIISTIILLNTSGILLNYDNSTFMKNILPPLFFSIVFILSFKSLSVSGYKILLGSETQVLFEALGLGTVFTVYCCPNIV